MAISGTQPLPVARFAEQHATPAWLAAAAVLLVVALALRVVAGRVQRAEHKEGGATAVGRLLAGIDLHHGRDHWTNAGWLTRPGEVTLTGAGTKRGRASWWQHQNYAFRSVVRSGWLPVSAAWVLAGAEAAAAAALALGLFAFYVRTRTRPGWLSAGWIPRVRGVHDAGRVGPLAEALAPLTNVSARAVERGLHWHPDYAESSPGDEVLRWDIPPAFKAIGQVRGTVTDLIESRVGFGLAASWRTSELPPVLVLSRARSLPPIVFLADVLDRVDALPASKTAIGLDDLDRLVCWDWGCETPHGVMNAGSRHGKSETNKCLICQILRKGGSVTAIDVKEISFQGLEGLPRFTLVNDPGDIPAMWEAIADFAGELNVRRAERAAGTATSWPVKLLIIEEANQFGEMTDDCWEDLPCVDDMEPEERALLRGTELWKTKGAKKTPRVWRHVKAVAWQGAAFNMHVLVDGQDMKDSVVKGLRNSLGMRLLGGYLPQQWKFLVGTTPVPAAPAVKGRFCLVIGNQQTWLQAILADLDPDMSSRIWRDFALNGLPDPGPGGTGDGDRRQFTDDSVPPQVSASSAAAPSPVTGDQSIPMTLLSIVRIFLAPDAPDEDQKKLAAALKQDRQRHDRGALPPGLIFPGPVGTDGQAELFLPHQVIAFNTARRGQPAARNGGRP
jgi:hypothetical protein